MAIPPDARWRRLAATQHDILARRQLLGLGYTHHYVDAQVAAERWREISDVVVSTVTGPPSRKQLMWAGVLHAGPASAISGFSALELRGLRGWERPAITVSLPKSRGIEPIAGIRFAETRRPVWGMRGTRQGLPSWHVEPAALLMAGYHLDARAAYGLLAAVVQQGLTTPERLQVWIRRMHPLRRAKSFRQYCNDIAGGVQSAAEGDIAAMCRLAGLPQPVRQRRREDASGRLRYTDNEWITNAGRLVILEVEGGFHMEARQWAGDIERERDLVVASGAIVIRCTSTELRDTPERVAESLIRLGVGRSSA